MICSCKLVQPQLHSKLFPTRSLHNRCIRSSAPACHAESMQCAVAKHPWHALLHLCCACSRPKNGTNKASGTTVSTSTASPPKVQAASAAAQPPADDDPLLQALAGEAAEDEDANATGAAGWAATLGVLGGIAVLLGGGYVFKDAIKHFLDFFIQAVDDWGVWVSGGSNSGDGSSSSVSAPCATTCMTIRPHGSALAAAAHQQQQQLVAGHLAGDAG